MIGERCLGDGMPNPRFSIVIPTRNRHTTLKYALLTCLNQKNFDDYEIIVCDNCSSPETMKTMESFESERIKYIRSDRPLAMNDNWELAISHAEGEYVILIGDDDGLLLNALYRIDKLLKELEVKAICWEYVYYNWPDLPTDKNMLKIPLVRKNSILQYREVISKVANSKWVSGYIIPELYNSAIHQDLIDLLRERTGRVFDALSPDVYSGFAFAYLARRYACSGLPMSICGHSATSGEYSVLHTKDNPTTNEWIMQNEESNIFCHPKIPDVPVAPAIIAESFQCAKDNLFYNDNNLCIDRKRLIKNCVNALKNRYLNGVDNLRDLEMHLGKIRISLADDARLQRWFDRKYKDPTSKDLGMSVWFHLLKKCDQKLFANTQNNSLKCNGFDKGFKEKDLILDASDFGLKNAFDVADFCEKFYSTNVNGLEWHGKGIKSELLIEIKKARPRVRRMLSNYI